jgi:SSS family solute:Na+ symporter
VVLPGIAAVILFPEIEKPDQAYPSMMSLMPVGIKGLVFAALVAAIISSLASMTNSISTIFTMDLYRPMRQGKDENHYVNVGRLATVTSLFIAVCVAQPLIGQSEQAFQYIQEFTGLFSPGITVIFLMGMFWKRTTSTGALAAAIGSALFSVLFAVFLPEIPFMDRIGIVFLMCLALTCVVSLRESAPKNDHSVSISDVSFSTTKGFNIAGIGCVLILIGLYATWW